VIVWKLGWEIKRIKNVWQVTCSIIRGKKKGKKKTRLRYLGDGLVIIIRANGNWGTKQITRRKCREI